MKRAGRVAKQVRHAGGECSMQVAPGMAGHNVTRDAKHRTVPPSVAAKTAVLIHEGKPAAQAYATAWSMKRAGRLSASGAYRRKGR